MAKDKSGFLLYSDLIHTVRKMPREKVGDLFVTILEYVNDENPVVDDVIVDLVFEPIKQQLKRDLQKFEKTVEKRREAGKLGGIKSGESRTSKQNEANASLVKQNEANEADNDNVNDTVTVTDNVTEIVIMEDGKSATPPPPDQSYSDEEKILFKNFQDWIKKFAPRVGKMKEPFTIDQYLSLKNKEYKVERIRELLTDMHNWADLHKKRVSAYLTLLNWKRREEK